MNDHYGRLFCAFRRGRAARVLTIGWMLAAISPAQTPAAGNRYTVILEDAPATSRGTMRQHALRAQFEQRSIVVTGAADTLLNALFVVAPADRLAELRATPGVRDVVPARWLRPAMNRAATVVNAAGAWSSLGGAANAGKGVKIGVIDSGIDHKHPAFANSKLSVPAGFPKCTVASDCTNFTNNKVIVARDFVYSFSGGSDARNPAPDDTPDDRAPRDLLGHGTAVASVVAGESASGYLTIQGVAPGAWLGSYRVFGSPDLNGNAPDSAVILALEQAVKDGMDVVNLSLGDWAHSGPLDSGSVCGLAAGVSCAPLAAAVEAAVHRGVVVVVSSGNDNGSGTAYPTFGTVGSPGDAPSAITVGASSNAHLLMASVSLVGTGAPQGLAAVAGATGFRVKPLTAPLVDVSALGGDGTACAALPAGSLIGSIALAAVATCANGDAVLNLTTAGASGIVFFRSDSSAPYAISSAGIPVVMLGRSDGLTVKNYLASHAGASVTLAGLERSNTADLLLRFSSIGPSTGDVALKPDLVAPGGGTWSSPRVPGIYAATATNFWQASMYNAEGYLGTSGTSFAAPIVSGAAALVKQAHPTFTPAQIKSALVNTAANVVTRDDSDTPVTVDVRSAGAGRLDVTAAVSNAITVAVADGPSDARYLASASFGVVTAATLPMTKQITVTNTGTGSANLMLSVTGTGALLPSIAPTSMVVPAGGSGTATVTLAKPGTFPGAGAYTGVITIQGPSTLRVPYAYFVVSGTVSAGISMPPDNSTVALSTRQELRARVLDANGIGVAGAQVSWTPPDSGGTVSGATSTTDRYGIARIVATTGSQPGGGWYRGSVNGIDLWFWLAGRTAPAVAAGAVVNGASHSAAQGIAPGSYIEIFGTELSDVTRLGAGDRLPVTLDGVSVSFDVPPAGISVPGRLVFVGSGQVNVQAPWELAGQSSAQMKVSVRAVHGNVVSVPVSDFSPAFFEIAPGVVAALDGNYQTVTPTHPVARGQLVQLYANGLGPVSNTPATGEPASADPLSWVPASSGLKVLIGGKEAKVYFAGLAPGFPALYQINAEVPADLATGNQTLLVMVGGVTSPTTGIVVQ